MWPFTRKPKATRGGSPPGALGRLIPAMLRGRYDAAQTTPDNARHWAMADGLSADAAASPDVRAKLRERSRYEVANNSYAKGIVLTLANDCVGTGARLQILSEDSRTNNRVEAEFTRWAHAVGLAQKLRTMRVAKATDGEAFAMLTHNPRIDSPVKMDVQLVEADRVTSPSMSVMPIPNEVDGIIHDGHGNPLTYTVLRHHPGDVTRLAGRGDEFDLLDADDMIHWFRADRPDQHRGVPEITPALPLFAQLRRYTLAVLAAAETAADFAAVLFTDAPADGEGAQPQPMDVIELEKRMATVLPDGWKLGQIDAQQPTTSYGEFKRELLNEIARCLNLPFNIAAGNSAGYNYASGRLDHQTYYKSIRVEQAHLAEMVLERIFQAWLKEARLVHELAYVHTLGSPGRTVPHQWFFDGTEHVDPAKEANAQATRLKSNTTTLATEYARQGKDWEAELQQRAKEKRLMQKLGLTDADTPEGMTPPTDNEDDTDVDTDPGRDPGHPGDRRAA